MKNNLSAILSTIVLLTILTNAQAQENPYYFFELKNTSYRALDMPVILNTKNVTQVPYFYIKIPFNFVYFNHYLDSIEIEPYGQISVFDQGKKGASGVISIFKKFVTDRSNTEEPASFISYQVINEAPNRVFIIEWKNMGFDTSKNDFINMQAWLYEGSNSIEFHYGDSWINNPKSIGKPEAGMFSNNVINMYGAEAYFLEKNPDLPFLVREDKYEPFFTALDSFPSEGIVYSFKYLRTPPILGTAELTKENFIIYPNPCKNQVKIQWDGEQKISSVKLLNMLGQEANADWNENEKTLRFSGLPAGIYLVQLQSGSGVHTQRIRIEDL